MEPSRTKTSGADILRGLAILMVVVYHAFGPTYGFCLPWNGWTRDFAASPSPQLFWFYPVTFGWCGVALFFVLSGFCIHLSYLRSAPFVLSHFFWRRFWRIYPAYLLALLTFTVINRVNPASASGARQIVSHLLLVQNFSEETFFGINPSFWSIAVEVQLYLLFPILIYIRSRIGIGGCLLVTFALGMIWRVVAVSVWGIPDLHVAPAFSSPLMTWFDWTLGAYVAERFFKGERAITRGWIGFTILIPLFVVSTFYKPLTSFSFSLAAAISAIALDAALQVRWRPGLWVTGLSFIGTISYSVYLWHQPRLLDAAFRLKRLVGSPSAAWLGVAVLLIGGSWLSFRLFELPAIDAGKVLWRRLHLKSKGRASQNQP